MGAPADGSTITYHFDQSKALKTGLTLYKDNAGAYPNLQTKMVPTGTTTTGRDTADCLVDLDGDGEYDLKGFEMDHG